MTSSEPDRPDVPVLDADEGDPPTDQLGADLDDSGTDGRPGPEERDGVADGGNDGADDVQRAPAGPEDPPVDPAAPTNPA